MMLSSLAASVAAILSLDAGAIDPPSSNTVETRLEAAGFDNVCRAQSPASRDQRAVGNLTMGELSRHVLAFAVGLDRQTPYAALELANVCRALGVPLVDSPAFLRLMSSPHGPPPGPDEHLYKAMLARDTDGYVMHIDHYSGPRARSVTYSLTSEADPRPPYTDGLWADMGARCELRAREVAGQLQEGGYSMDRVGYETPPRTGSLLDDQGPVLVFRRGTALVTVRMQGEFAAQRRNGLDACVAKLEVFTRAEEHSAG